MAYKEEVIEGDEAIRNEILLNSMYMGNLTEEVIEMTRKIQWERSDFNDPGADWNEVVFYDFDGEVIHRHRSEGY